MPSTRQIGPFEILEPLGAGGMGEVFKARDTRLNRLVAIKFLPEAAGATARERFQREAQAVAALNHPNICTLFEVGDDAGRPFLVLELLEGESLKMRLRRGHVSPEQILDWAIEIAEALDAAHRKGVLHRDLKPDNLWVTTSGHIKVLDFGLARLSNDAADQSGEAPTIDMVLTSPGQTMGTIPYMSPEQARGESLDARSDLFSFGSVLYEMATGRPAFAGRSAAEVSASILKEQPPRLTTARPDLPAKLEDITSRCLEKDPDLRYQSAADLRIELKRLKRETASSITAPAAAAIRNSKPETRNLSWLWPAIAVTVVLVAGLAYWKLRPRTAAAPVRLQFHQLTYSGNVEDAVISPDGKFLAHVDDGPQGTSLHLLSIASNSDVQIMPPAPGCCQSPSFSPDGSQVYFLENRVLKAVPLLGGAVRTIAAQACSGAGFSPDGSQIVYIVSTGLGMRLVLAHPDGSEPRRLSDSDPGAGYVGQCWGVTGQPTHSPAWSPDGSRIAVVEAGNSQIGHIVLINAADGHMTTLAPDVGFVAGATWLPDGRNLVVSASIPANAAPQVWEIAADSSHATQLTDDLAGYSSVSVAANGTLAVVHAAPQYALWAQVKPGGEFQPLPGGGADQDGSSGVAWTPTGGLVSTHIVAANSVLWSEAADGSNGRQLDIAAISILPAVAPDGEIVFTGEGTPNNVFRVAADGTSLQPLAHPSSVEQTFDTAPIQGQAVAYVFFDTYDNQTLWSVPLAGGAPRQISPAFIFADGIAASPDGARIFAVVRGAGADDHVPATIRVADGQVTPVPGMNFKTMPPPYGWTADGKAITYVVNQGTVDNIWAYPIAGGKPYPLTHFTDLRIPAYAMSKDGRLVVSRGTPNQDAVMATGLGVGQSH